MTHFVSSGTFAQSNKTEQEDLYVDKMHASRRRLNIYILITQLSGPPGSHFYMHNFRKSTISEGDFGHLRLSYTPADGTIRCAVCDFILVTCTELLI